MKLYEIAEEMAVIERMMTEEDVDQESFEKYLNSLNIERDAKLANIGLLVKQVLADIAARKALMDELKRKNEADERRIEWLKAYALGHIDKPVKTLLLTMARYQGREKVTIYGPLPEQYLIPQEPKVDKKAVMEALKAGDAVPGASLDRGDDFLVIR